MREVIFMAHGGSMVFGGTAMCEKCIMSLMNVLECFKQSFLSLLFLDWG